MTRNPNPELPKKILAEAERIIEHEGLDGLNMRRLAKRVGVTATAIYHYFQNKDELLLEVRLHAAEKLNEKVRRIHPALHPHEALTALANAYIAFAEEHPNLYHLLVESRIGETLAGPSEKDVLYHTYYAARSLLERLPDDKGGPGEPSYEAMMGWVMLHGFCSLLIAGSFEAVEKANRDQLKSLFLRFYRGEAGRKSAPKDYEPNIERIAAEEGALPRRRSLYRKKHRPAP
jgi:AcrR family transcriptional regulator